MRLRPPAQIRARVPQGRVLGWAVSGSSSIIATDRALLLPEGSELAQIPWDLVLRVTWEMNTAEVTYQLDAGERPETVRVSVVLDEGDLPAVVQERVNASIYIQHHARLEGDLGARFVARRAPGSVELRWSVVFDSGLDSRDPDLRARADVALANLRSVLGI